MNPKNEPTAWGGALTALAVAVIPFLRAFNVNISEQQGDAIMTLLGALILVGTLFLRSKVVTVTKAESAVEVALDSTPTTSMHPGAARDQVKEILATSSPR